MLWQRHAKGGYRNILFIYEKIFTVEQKFNRQNDKIYAHSSQEASEGFNQYPSIPTVRAVIDEWPDRLKTYVKVKGGHFEYILFYRICII